MSRVRPSGRFPATQRLRKRREFQRVQSSGLRVVSPGFVFLLCESGNSAQAPCRLGVVASRRVGNAVVRNRAKRLVREAFRATRELWPSGIDLVVVVRQPPGKRRLADIVADWHSVARALSKQAGRCTTSARIPVDQASPINPPQAAIRTDQQAP